MPSTSKKQHNFMAAIANSPSFAKKVGISQSVGKDFSAADKGKKFGRGGMAAINKQDTQHGKMDMPFKSLKKFGGMKAGGKVRRFDEGGLSAEQKTWLGGADATDPHILRRMRNAVPDKAPVEERTITPASRAPVEERTITPVSRPSAAPADGHDYLDSFKGSDAPASAPASAPAAAKPAGPAAGPASGPSRENKTQSAKKSADAAELYRESNRPNTAKFKEPVTYGNSAGDIRAYDKTQSAKKSADAAELSRESKRVTNPAKATSDAARVERLDELDKKNDALQQEKKSKDKSDDNTQMSGMDKVAIGAGATGAAAGLGAAALAARKGQFQPALNIIKNLVSAKATRYAKQGEAAAKAADRGVRNPILEEARARNIAEGTKSRNATRLDNKNRKLKEDKAKEDAYDARRSSDMVARFKKGGTTKMARGGMPMKDGKPAFMQKKMNMGGMAKYAKGGGIESRGKTKGTVIRMASGGSVSARADGIAQRGKTKFRVY